jgi:S1-C subfamily serine protease
MMMEIEERYVKAVEKASASIVSVRAGVSPRRSCCGPSGRMGLTSGVVLDKEGYVLTSRHAVSQMESVTVILNNGHVFSGKVVGEDQRTDIAVIKIESEELVPAELGDSEKLRTGQPILAMGNPLGLPGGPVVTSGVISFIPRGPFMGQSEMSILATDASVNPGNGGGPLVNLDGMVVAVNATRAPFAEGMSLAIPVNMAKGIAEQIIKHGKVQRSWLGITAYDITPPLAYQFQLPDNNGVFVAEVQPSGPAEGAGLKMGDVLLGLDDKHVACVSDLLTTLNGMSSGQEIVVKMRRNGRTEEVHVTLGTRPY